MLTNWLPATFFVYAAQRSEFGLVEMGILPDGRVEVRARSAG